MKVVRQRKIRQSEFSIGRFSEFKGKRILLLQGPLGPFFRRLAHDLNDAGAIVHKINFNGGDWLFFSKEAIAFTGHAEQWPDFFEQILDQHKIEMVMLFGDCRPLHRLAHTIADSRGIEIGVFEEGYVRPDYITFERFGVNAHSQISRDPSFYLALKKSEIPPTSALGKTFWHAARWAFLYYCASILLRPYFRHYQHHRPLAVQELGRWLRSAWRKYYFLYKEKGIWAKLASSLSQKYFLVALQVHNDAQLHVHSKFASVEDFIDGVIFSFAQSAPVDTYLVIKHHPMDRGYHDYSALIKRLIRTYSVEGRVLYIHDQHLPTLLEHARGVVLVNSTVGLSALHHAKPLMVCGAAIYDMPGLTYQGSLDSFWQAAESAEVDTVLYKKFRNYLIEHTQLNGSFYRRLETAGPYTGLGGASLGTAPMAPALRTADEKRRRLISL